MLYKISDVIQNYLKYDKVTRFEMNQKQFFPNVVLMFTTKVFKWSKLKAIFPQMRQENDYIEALKINNITVRNYAIRTIIPKYLEKLINELRFKEFLDITYGKNFIKSCKVFKNRKAFNCSESKYGIYKTYNTIKSLTFAITFEDKKNSLYENNVCFAESLDKIELELNGTGYTNVLVSCKPSLTSNERISFDKNTKTEISFTSYSFKQLSIHKEKRLEVNNQKLKNYTYDKCVIDCYYRNLNQTYGCLPTVSWLHF
jgi:hypothetical protein